MKSYLRYFWLIARNWNIGVAAYMIYHEIRGNRKYGADTMDMESLDYLRVLGKNKVHGSFYQGSSYSLLETAFDFLKNRGVTGAVVDYGAGKGRILVVAAFHGFAPVRGIEFAPELCEIAQRNLDKLPAKYHPSRIELYCMDAIDYPVSKDDHIFFFFNPFSEPVMLQVVKNILASVKKHPREIYVVYLNPVCEELFLSAGFVLEYHVLRLRYIEMSIYSLPPSDPF